MAEFWDYLEVIVWEVKTGRLEPNDVPARLIEYCGGTMLYLPKKTPAQRQQIKALIAMGISERTARAKVRGR